MTYIDPDERGMLYDLVHALVLKLNDQRSRADDAERRLAAAEERLSLLGLTYYGAV